MAQLFYSPKFQALSNAGVPLAGARLFFYATGTTTATSVYTDSALSVAHSNPVVADAGGYFAPIYTGSANLRAILRTEANTLVWDVDPWTPVSVSTAQVGAALYPQTSIEQAASITPSSYVYPFLDPRRYGAADDLAVDSTTAIQTALNLALASAGGVVTLPAGGSSKITAVISIPASVTLDLNGGTIWQYTSNIAIVNIAANATRWGIRNGLLRYLVQQTTAETGATGLQLATASSVTYLGNVEGITVDKAYRGFTVPNLASCYSFLVNFDTCLAYQCSDYGFFIQGDTATGGCTNIRLDNCWVAQPSGSEVSTSKGYAFRGVSQLSFGNLATDHIQSQYALWVENCTGSGDTFLAESCDWTASSGVNAMVLVDGGTFRFGLLGAAANNVTISGTADWTLLRQATASNVEVNSIRDVNTAVTDTSSGAYYTAYMSATGNRCRIFYAIAAGTTPALAYEDSSWPRQIESSNGVERAIINGSATYDPGSLADAAGVTTTVTVTGAALGDYVEGVSFSLDLQGITTTAWVSAANTVSVRLQNETGGTLDLSSGTLRARVRRI